MKTQVVSPAPKFGSQQPALSCNFFALRELMSEIGNKYQQINKCSQGCGLHLPELFLETVFSRLKSEISCKLGSHIDLKHGRNVTASFI